MGRRTPLPEATGRVLRCFRWNGRNGVPQSPAHTAVAPPETPRRPSDRGSEGRRGVSGSNSHYGQDPGRTGGFRALQPLKEAEEVAVVWLWGGCGGAVG